MNTGNVIKKLRQDKKLTQDELSRILGVKKSSIQKYESGAVSNLKMETIRTLCDYFNVPPSLIVFPEHKDTNNVFVFMKSLNKEGTIKVIEYARDLVDCGNYKN